ncbi:hypothetical protein CNE_1c27930 [Cupriavidus necator N-1]|uniref:Uncharacterized protein n=1 Tax=Cupriavidus necator (strain ATCC 43291 / DSM 13513 / CCUG 52238 / LMG 8453 / N-1) TaxID=1042878 RepID=G0ETQ8_CUPNN|nr:hypothetical protein CNE_1c27930 [Cupriavidus necator N-1]KAI3602296.1 hypothetical protein D8I24_3436 [Cupriavidus necator H850]
MEIASRAGCRATLFQLGARVCGEERVPTRTLSYTSAGQL